MQRYGSPSPGASKKEAWAWCKTFGVMLADQNACVADRACVPEDDQVGIHFSRGGEHAFSGISAHDPARNRDTHFLQFANVDGQVACGFLLGQAQNFFRGSWQQSGGSGILAQ